MDWNICLLCWHAVLMPFMLAQMFGLNADACILLTCGLFVTLPLSSPLLVAISKIYNTARFPHFAASAAMFMNPSWPQCLTQGAARKCCRHSRISPTTSAAQLWTTLASTQTIFTLSALTSLTVLSMSEGVSNLNTRSEATKVHTCMNMVDMA